MDNTKMNSIGIECAPRSQLYSIEPQGIGTPFVESLTSYLARLAQYHRVLTGTLVNQVLAPWLNKEYLSRAAKDGGCRFYERSSCLNGMGSTACEVKDLLESLTGRSDLASLTLLSWSGFVAARGLQRKHRTWCSRCLNDFLNECRVVYEPLIWSLQLVEVCPIHKLPLNDKCFSCGRTTPPLTRKSVVGYCFHCHSWLGDTTSHKQYQNEFQRFCADEAMNVLQLAQHASRVLDMPSILNDLTSNVLGMRLAQLAAQIGFPKVTLWEWQKGNVKPSLSNLLEFCYRLNVSVEALMQRRWSSVNAKISCNLTKQTEIRNTRSIDWDFVREELEEIRESTDILSMEQVAKRLGYAKRLLYKHWPEQCKSISKKYIDKLTNSRKTNIQLDRFEVLKIAEYLISSGDHPSQRRIEALSSKPSILRSAKVKQEWTGLIQTSSINRLNQRL